MRTGVLAMVLLGLGCAHSDSRPAAGPKCGDKPVALRVARNFAEQTERSDRVRVRLDETRVEEQPDKWKVWTLVGERSAPRDAYLVVTKADCHADWALLLYEM